MLQQEMTVNQKVSVSVGATAYLGGYSLKGAPGSPDLHLSDEFLDQIYYLSTVLGDDAASQSAMYQIVANFGTHYVNRVWYGGLGEETCRHAAPVVTSAPLLLPDT